MDNILIRSGDAGPWEEPRSYQFSREVALLQILAEHPSLIPGVGPEAKACKEFRSDAGYTDLVVVDADGSITLVECKLASNPQIRREIVGQMFDYASRFWKMNIAEFEGQWLARTKRSGATGPLFTKDEEPDMVRREALSDNLADGRFRIVLAVDEINSDLKRMVEYLNSMAGPETVIIAVEYTRLTTGLLEILMPQTYGEEIAEAKIADEERQQRQWTVDEYQTWISQNDRGNADKFSRLVAEADKRRIPFTGSPVRSKASAPAGGFRITNQRRGWIGTLYVYHYAGGNTSLELSFANKENRNAMARIDAQTVNSFLTSIRRIPEFEAAAEALKVSKYAKRPNVPLANVADGSIDSLIEALSQLRDDAGR